MIKSQLQTKNNPLSINYDFANDTAEKIKTDTEKLRALILSHKSSGDTLNPVEIKNLEQAAERLELRRAFQKSKFQHEMDTFNGSIEITNLTKNANCKNITLHLSKNTKHGQKECLLNQFAAIHKLTMQFAGHAGQQCQSDEIAQRYCNLAIKGSKACANIALTLDRLENGGKQNIEVKHQYVQVNDGGQAVIASKIQPEGGVHEK